MKHIFLIIIFFCSVFVLRANSSDHPVIPRYPYIHFGVEEGLPQSIVSDIIEDSYGFIWLSTNEGLVRFDGHTFKVYNKETGYPFRLVTGIIEKEPGVIWVGTLSAGLWRIHGEKAEQIFFTNRKRNSQINFLSKTQDGEILLASEKDGVYIFKPDTILHLSCVDQNGPIPGPVISGAKDYSGNYWFGTFEYGVLVVKDGQVVKHISTQDGLPSNEIRSILALPTKQIWIGTRKGLLVLPDTNISDQFNQQFNEVFISRIYSNDNQNIWINASTNPGGVIHYKDGHLLEILRGFEGIYSKCTFINRSGALFLGTYRGLFVFPDRNFQNFGAKEGLHDTYVRAVVKDHTGKLWVATKNDGLYYFAEKRFIKEKRLSQRIKETVIYTLKEINQELWLGTGKGLFIIKNGNFVQNKLTEFFKDMVIRRFITGPNQKVYIITRNRLYLFQDDELQDLTYNLGPKKYSLWALAEDEHHRLWLGSNLAGLWQLQDTTWKLIETRDSVRNYFSIKKDKNENIYFATSDGLLKWNGSQLVKELDIQQTIWDILPTKNNGVWLLCSKGLYRYDGEDLRFYSRKTGLVTSEFNMGATFYESDSCIWFGGVDGLVHYKKTVNYPDIKPELYITNIESPDSNYIFPFPDKLVLKPNEKNIKINFTALDFQSALVYNYAYYLEGFSNDTLLVQDQFVVNYTNLADGSYTFHLFLKSPYSGKVLAHKKIHFVLLKPWWKSVWFLLFITVFFFLIVYSFVRWRIIILKNKNIMLEKRIEDRTRDIQLSYKLLKNEVEERKKAQLNLKQEREQLAITLKSIADGVIRTDSKGKILLMNSAAERISGVSENMAIGKSINEVLHLFEETSEERIRLPEYLTNNAIDKGMLMNITAILKNNHSDVEKIVALGWSLIEQNDQQDAGYVWVLRDISTERKLENEILKSQKLESIGLLAGGIAHDFNNFLSGILGNTQLAQIASQQKKNIEKYLKSIEEATKNATHLTKQLLTFAKGGQPLKEIVSLKSLIIDSVDFSTRGSSIHYEVEIDPDLWAVEADKGQINQVINNLVINAIQAMPSGGNLYIKANNFVVKKKKTSPGEVLALKKGKYVQLIFKDTGIGIPKDNLSKIFDSYFTTKQKGSGLGLATTYAIIEKHNGYIFVNSKLGEGTVFTIYLPASPDATLNKKDGESKLKRWQGKRVLVMDDEMYIRELIGNFLELLGFEVSFAEDGAKAIEEYETAFQQNKAYDLVIMDLTIRGGMGGKEAVSKILEIDPKARVIVASGYSTDSVLAQYEEFGFMGRLSKPFTLENLNSVILKVLG